MDEHPVSSLPNHPRRLRIADIAARTGLHKSTISRAVNGKPRVAERTRARVLAALRETNYVPNHLAASLRTGRTGLLGVVMNGPDDPIRLAAMQGAINAADPANYGVVVYMTQHERDRRTVSPEMIAKGWVDGALILWPGRASESFVRRIHEIGLPLVLIEPEVEMAGVPAVYSDAYSDGYVSTRHLLDLGHRRIAMCANPPSWGIEGRYLDGYYAALAAAGIAADPVLGLAPGWTFEVGYETAVKWLRFPDRPTGMCFRTDMAALGAIAAARDLGLRVPEDLAIVGGDDTQMATWIKPTLTALRQQRERLTEAACELLLGLIDGREPPVEPVLVRTDVVPRQSTIGER